MLFPVLSKVEVATLEFSYMPALSRSRLVTQAAWKYLMPCSRPSSSPPHPSMDVRMASSTMSGPKGSTLFSKLWVQPGSCEKKMKLGAPGSFEKKNEIGGPGSKSPLANIHNE